MMNAKEQLIREIQEVPDSVIVRLLEVLPSMKIQARQPSSTEIARNLDTDPLLAVIGIFDSEAISSGGIDRELYG